MSTMPLLDLRTTVRACRLAAADPTQDEQQRRYLRLIRLEAEGELESLQTALEAQPWPPHDRKTHSVLGWYALAILAVVGALDTLRDIWLYEPIGQQTKAVAETVAFLLLVGAVVAGLWWVATQTGLTSVPRP
jgi:hypothetical protein